MENNEDEINNINNDFNYDETVEIIDEKNGCVNEGKILSIRGDLLIVYNKDKKKKKDLIKKIILSLSSGNQIDLFKFLIE